MERFLRNGLVGRHDLPENVRRERRALARAEAAHFTALMEDEPIGVQVGIVPDTLPHTSFQIFRQPDRQVLALSPFRLGEEPNIRVGVAMITSAPEALALHEKMAKDLWQRALKGALPWRFMRDLLARTNSRAARTGRLTRPRTRQRACPSPCPRPHGADQLGHLLDAAFVAPGFEVVDDRDQRGRIAEAGIADADRAGAGQHVFDDVLGLGHAADADDRDLDLLGDLIDHPQHDRLQRRRDQPAELVAERRAEIVGPDLQRQERVGDHQAIGAGVLGGLARSRRCRRRWARASPTAASWSWRGSR